LQPGGVASPPFSVSNQQDDLGDMPLPSGFVQLPIFNHNEVSMLDDLDYKGCHYINTVDGYRFTHEETYSSVEYLKDDLRAPISAAFGLNKT